MPLEVLPGDLRPTLHALDMHLQVQLLKLDNNNQNAFGYLWISTHQAMSAQCSHNIGCNEASLACHLHISGYWSGHTLSPILKLVLLWPVAFLPFI